MYLQNWISSFNNKIEQSNQSIIQDIYNPKTKQIKIWKKIIIPEERWKQILKQLYKKDIHNIQVYCQYYEIMNFLNAFIRIQWQNINKISFVSGNQRYYNQPLQKFQLKKTKLKQFLIKFGKKYWFQLQELKISFKLADIDIKNIFTYFYAYKFNINYPNLSHFISLKKLILSQSKIGPKGIHYLRSSLFPIIKQIQLSHNYLGSQGIKQICKSSWPNLRSLRICYNKIKFNGFESLYLNNWTKMKFFYLREQNPNSLSLMQIICVNWPSYYHNCSTQYYGNYHRPPWDNVQKQLRNKYQVYEKLKRKQNKEVIQ